MEPFNRTLPAVLSSLVRTAPLSPGKVAFVWRAIVGLTMARATSVLLEGDVLLVDASSAWVPAVISATPLILGRLQELLGPDVVRRIQVRRLDS